VEILAAMVAEPVLVLIVERLNKHTASNTRIDPSAKVNYIYEHLAHSLSEESST
jgi:hypothetical protein